MNKKFIYCLIYIDKKFKNHFYTGITNNLILRINQHLNNYCKTTKRLNKKYKLFDIKYKKNTTSIFEKKFKKYNKQQKLNHLKNFFN